MKEAIHSLFVVVSLFFFSCISVYSAVDSTLCVYLKGGKVDAYPSEVVKAKEQTAAQLKLTLNNDSLITYDMSDVDSLGNAPVDFPQFTSFKFNNKYNENVYLDVFATIGKDSVKAKVGAIGKRLTPSFKLSSPDALVYVGDELQQSKVSRRRFEEPVTYTVTKPNYRKLNFQKIKEEEWSDGNLGGEQYEKIPLTVDMLQTNAPGYSYEGLDKMLDGDENTFFHSAYGDREDAPYVLVCLNQPVSSFVLEYVTRPDRPDYCPLEMIIECSKDGNEWVTVKHLTENDGIPTSGYAQKYTSPNIELGDEYSMFIFTVPRVEHKSRKYFVLAEFAMYKYLGVSEPSEPELISPAQYAYTWQPFGRDYVVDIDWLTDADTASVPRIDINLSDGYNHPDITKEVYLNASIQFDGGNVFPDLMVDSVLIKGRGNSTWHGPYGKNPYRLKFASSVKPFGLTKGKNWVLLANDMNESMMTNAIGMKIARMVGAAGANDIIPVELYINGEYRGSYNFTQHVGLHNNSVDIDETNAVRLELDTNWGDDDPSFSNFHYGVTTKIKDPDFQDLPMGSVLTQAMVTKDFNRFSMDLSSDVPDLEKWYDADMLARYFLVNELIQNEELMHPKSCFLYREDLLAMHSKYIFGPVWDLDWAYGYEHGWMHCPTNYSFDYFAGIENRGEPGGRFYSDLRRREAVNRAYYKVWSDFMKLHQAELSDFIEDYYAFAHPSFEHNATIWGKGNGYAEIAQRFKNWLSNRAQYIYNSLDVYDLDTPLPIMVGDVNKDGMITLADVVCVHNHLLGLESETFDEGQADANVSGDVTITDAVWIIAMVMQEQTNYTRHMMLPAAEAGMQTSNFSATLGAISEMPVTLNMVEGNYAATQFDVILPEGMSVEGIVLPEEWHDYEVQFSELEKNKYRVAVFSGNGRTFPTGISVLNLQLKPERIVKAEERVVSLDGITLVNKQGEDERMTGKSTTFDMEATGIDATIGKEAVSGGEALNIETLMDGEIKVYTVDGRLVKVFALVVGSNRISLPAGVYVVNHQKVVIK